MNTNAQILCSGSPDPATAASHGVHCIARDEIPGLTVVTMAAFMSLVAVSIIFALIARNIIRERGRSLFRKPMDVYMFSLFSADLLQALGGSLEVKWISDGFVQAGPVCTAQGFLHNIGQSAIAITTLIITLHTFVTLWWFELDRLRPVKKSLKVAWFLVGISWGYLILSLGISVAKFKNPPFYGPTPFWCWITNTYPNSRIAFQNCWLWFAFAASVLYIPLICWNQGYVTPSQKTWWRFDVHPKKGTGLPTASVLMLICALAYVGPTLPNSLARWFQTIQGSDAPFGTKQAQLIVNGIFMLSGLIDVLVFAFVRRGLLLFGPPDPDEQRNQGSQLTNVQNRGSLPDSITVPTLPTITHIPSQNLGTLPGSITAPTLPTNARIPSQNRGTLSDSIAGTSDHSQREESTQQASGRSNSVDRRSSEPWQQNAGETRAEPSPIGEPPVQNAAPTYPPIQCSDPSSEYPEPRPLSYWAIVLFVAWVCANIAYGFQIDYYIRSAIYPNPHTSINKRNKNWIAYFVLLHVTGFCLGTINLFVCGILFNRTYTWFHKEDSSDTKKSLFFTTLRNTLHILIALFLVIFLMLGPFFGPASAFRRVQKHAWDHKCDKFMAEIILNGRKYNDPSDTQLIASFSLRQTGYRTKQFAYNMTFVSNNLNTSYLQLGNVAQWVTASTQYYPLVQNVTFELTNSTFSADCVTSIADTNMTRSCITGSYNINNYFTITTHDTRRNVTSQYKAIDDNWYYPTAADAPNYIIKDVNFPRGGPVIETAVTRPGHCNSLLLCTSNLGDGGILAVAGLTFIQQEKYSIYCTTPNPS